MTPAEFLTTVIEPAAPLLPPADSPKARCLLLAIAGQESGWQRRSLDTTDAGRGFWRCLKNHGVLWVLHHTMTRPPLYHVCDALGVRPGLDEVYAAIETNDALAYCVARLLLVAGAPDAPLPEIGERRRAWSAYERLWKPAPATIDRWAVTYDDAARCFALPEAA